MSGWFVEVLTSTGLDNCLHFRASFTSDVLRVFHSLSRTSDGKIVILYRIIQYEVFNVHNLFSEKSKDFSVGLSGPYLYECKASLSNGLKWTRTTDLTLIRRAL